MKYFSLPCRDFCDIYIFDANNNMMFSWLVKMKPEQKEKLIEAINGEITLTIKDVKKDDLHIIINDTPILLVRGWGYLTGKLGLSEKEAIKEQEELLEYVEKKLKGLS